MYDENMEEKRCPRCELTKPIEDFSPRADSKSGQYTYCRPCKNGYMRDWARDNPEIHFKNNLRRRCNQHGITVEDYYRILEEQGGVCAICKTDTPSFRTTRFAVDHCHTTLEFRGLLCGPCNVGLGSFGDDAERLRAAADYLEKKKVCESS